MSIKILSWIKSQPLSCITSTDRRRHKIEGKRALICRPIGKGEGTLKMSMFPFTFDVTLWKLAPTYASLIIQLPCLFWILRKRDTWERRRLQRHQCIDPSRCVAQITSLRILYLFGLDSVRPKWHPTPYNSASSDSGMQPRVLFDPSLH